MSCGNAPPAGNHTRAMPASFQHAFAAAPKPRRRIRRRRPAGRCDRRVLAVRPVAPRCPTFLEHADDLPKGFTGFATRGMAPAN